MMKTAINPAPTESVITRLVRVIQGKGPETIDFHKLRKNSHTRLLSSHHFVNHAAPTPVALDCPNKSGNDNGVRKRHSTKPNTPCHPGLDPGSMVRDGAEAPPHHEVLTCLHPEEDRRSVSKDGPRIANAPGMTNVFAFPPKDSH